MERSYQRSLERVERSLQEHMEVGPVVQDIILRNCFNLLPFHYRRNNIQPPHSSFIRFTWTQGDQKRVEHYSYNMKLYEPAKVLHRVLFDGRCVIRVNNFEMTGTGRVHRLPIGFKVSADMISVPLEYISGVESILDSTSRCLKKLELCYPSRSFENLQHDVVQNAKKIFFLDLLLEDNNVLSIALRNLPNKYIKISFLHNSPTAEEFYGFIQIWIATKREIGSSCSFELNDEEMGDSVLNLVRARNETTEQTERSVTIIKEDRKQYEIIVKEKETQTSERFKWFFEVSFMGVS
ncbi:hypothetical protein B9Z55_007045 [Caenorhabditis nigoni]|uniref:F-box associated domain-containing protein n=1 Tax=Caenorhabditis nigoni TaxID=1611254 RepID=A0A2G5V854_9PELO|nr:hypothetical protein B9Z55_007045 [Caenorhabditis nigoni]